METRAAIGRRLRLRRRARHAAARDGPTLAQADRPRGRRRLGHLLRDPGQSRVVRPVATGVRQLVVDGRRGDRVLDRVLAGRPDAARGDAEGDQRKKRALHETAAGWKSGVTPAVTFAMT